MVLYVQISKITDVVFSSVETLFFTNFDTQPSTGILVSMAYQAVF